VRSPVRQSVGVPEPPKASVCDERDHHSLVAVRTLEWAYDVLVCEDCEFAIQVERDERELVPTDVEAEFRKQT
jgi:hypothetical protein